jgi:dihydroxy-acid dehydratase
MAAASVDLPAIVLPTGPMLVGRRRGEVLGACTDCRRMWGKFRAGEIDEAELDAVGGRLVPSVGFCSVMGTASTMACLTEALGLCLTLGASAPATHAERRRIAEATGRRAAQMAVSGGPRPSEILGPGAVHNALAVLHAIGGSTNGIVHLQAIAGRLGRPIDMEAFDRLGREVPVLVNMKPSGAHYMEHFHAAGGMPKLFKEISASLALDALTVGGGTIADAIAAAEEVPGQDVIRTRAQPLSPEGAIAVLRGNLAPRGAVIKQSAASPALMQHTGRAIVFESAADLADRMDDPALDVTADDVLVLRNTGPKGAPGMPEAGYLPIPRKLLRQGVKDMVRISDARMSGTAFGTIVLHITPESAAGGPLALVRGGDRIRLDVPQRRIELLVPEAELAARAKAAPPPQAPPARGYARLFQDHVMQADQGCDFDFLVGGGPTGRR